ncbi:MAG: hypothetical protein F4120_10375 [Rhodothermaceae bacterium]|nr:hypothetical protein [Rhodothermaceae bacterium]MXW31672.1 hypothetical protein [Rhodothermaceae bacterium]MYC05404.1 hypothetical protein [Rhodothermaceae bacterium]MYE63083.1 hypothetical protein [Rhodothermaceae bacterium]MYI18004.1 hypothetical protein [Rhodothermaceae bacterium]
MRWKMFFRHSLTLFTLVLFVACPAVAQVTGLGSTTFENSGSMQAQEEFSRGLLLLHSFEYVDAREAFAEARKIDPDFAMAYWGEAMTHNHPIWMQQDAEDGRSVLLELAPDLEGRLEKAPTEREKEYLLAVEALYFGEGDKKARDFLYEKKMGALAAKYPKDLEAAAFHALSILGLAHDGRDFRLYMRAAAIAEEVFAKNPLHPGAAHYLIHAYDDPIHAPLGLRAARVYAAIAPEATHALHMPSHIFTAMGMWPEMASANEASFAASNARVQRKGLSVNQRSFHARHWLAYAYSQQGRYAEAEQLMQDMINDLKEGGDLKSTRRYTVMMAASHLAETKQWDSKFARVEFDLGGMSAVSKANILFIRGKTALSDGDEESARQALKAIMDLDDKEDVSLLLQHQLKADLLVLEGNLDEAIKLLKTAAKIEEDRPLDYGPPMPAKPTYELLGEFHLKAKNGADAMKAFKASLGRAPGRSLSLIGLSAAAKMEGDKGIYQETMSMLKKNWKNADPKTVKMFSVSDH